MEPGLINHLPSTSVTSFLEEEEEEEEEEEGRIRRECSGTR
jgi:hypothetical protein